MIELEIHFKITFHSVFSAIIQLNIVLIFFSVNAKLFLFVFRFNKDFGCIGYRDQKPLLDYGFCSRSWHRSACIKCRGECFSQFLKNIVGSSFKTYLRIQVYLHRGSYKCTVMRRIVNIDLVNDRILVYRRKVLYSVLFYLFIH